MHTSENRAPPPLWAYEICVNPDGSVPAEFELETCPQLKMLKLPLVDDVEIPEKLGVADVADEYVAGRLAFVSHGVEVLQPFTPKIDSDASSKLLVAVTVMLVEDSAEAANAHQISMLPEVEPFDDLCLAQVRPPPLTPETVGAEPDETSQYTTATMMSLVSVVVSDAEIVVVDDAVDETEPSRLGAAMDQLQVLEVSRTICPEVPLPLLTVP